MAHWTSANSKAFIHRITFDFIAQLEKKLDCLGLKQSELAKKLDVTEGSVSQVLNSERSNLTLKTMVSYAAALNMKIAIVAYDDHDPNNEYGPVGSELFSTAWAKVGSPRDIWALNSNIHALATNRSCALTVWTSNAYPTSSSVGWLNSTWNKSTSSEIPALPDMAILQSGEADARS